MSPTSNGRSSPLVVPTAQYSTTLAIDRLLAYRRQKDILKDFLVAGVEHRGAFCVDRLARRSCAVVRKSPARIGQHFQFVGLIEEKERHAVHQMPVFLQPECREHSFCCLSPVPHGAPPVSACLLGAGAIVEITHDGST